MMQVVEALAGRRPAPDFGDRLLARATFGSRLYCLERDDSDQDLMEVHGRPQHPPRIGTTLRVDLMKFLRMVRIGDGRAVDVLWQPLADFDFVDPVFAELAAGRELLAYRENYRLLNSGFARRLIDHAVPGKSRLKEAVQLARLALAAEEFLGGRPYPAAFADRFPAEAAAIRAMAGAGDEAGLLALAQPHLGWLASPTPDAGNRYFVSQAVGKLRASSCAACRWWTPNADGSHCQCRSYCGHPEQEPKAVTDRAFRRRSQRCPLPQKPPGWEETIAAIPASPPPSPAVAVRPAKKGEGPPRWAVGVQAVASRLETYLPTTLASIAAAGFPPPRLFVDDCEDAVAVRRRFGLEATGFWPRARVGAAWHMALAELAIREPLADLYAVFQDDVVCCRNLREYLERAILVPAPKRGWAVRGGLERAYFNLLAMMDNEPLVGPSHPTGWREAGLKSKRKPAGKPGADLQTGRGAQAIVLPRHAAVALLSQERFIRRHETAWRFIDGGIVNCMNLAGFRETIHNPSLVQHIGLDSSIGNEVERRGWVARTFPGEGYDALDFLKGRG